MKGRMDLRDLYQSGPPCMSRAVDGFVRIGTVSHSTDSFTLCEFLR